MKYVTSHVKTRLLWQKLVVECNFSVHLVYYLCLYPAQSKVMLVRRRCSKALKVTEKTDVKS